MFKKHLCFNKKLGGVIYWFFHAEQVKIASSWADRCAVKNRHVWRKSEDESVEVGPTLV